uniref:Uncharacterized protein n=1 Tax=Fagus sylvatica TaxID=28930 RepID=A0A2N9J634_FAGSY
MYKYKYMYDRYMYKYKYMYEYEDKYEYKDKYMYEDKDEDEDEDRYLYLYKHKYDFDSHMYKYKYEDEDEDKDEYKYEYEDEDEGTNYSVALECLNWLISLEGNTIFPMVLKQLLREYLAAPEWQRRHSALIAVVQFKEMLHMLDMLWWQFILLRMYWGLHVIVYSQVATLFYGSGVVVYGVWFIWGGLGDALSSAASLGWLASPFP